jgi:hypothetical protein
MKIFVVCGAFKLEIPIFVPTVFAEYLKPNWRRFVVY